jgi:uncharacterized protein YkwD
MDKISERKVEKAAPAPQAATDPFQQQMFTLVNNLRKQKKRAALRWNNNLANAATGHVQDLITYGWNSPDPHNANNVDWVKRIERAGYTEWYSLRENAAMNSAKLSAATVNKLFQQLVNSPPHLANMLAKDVRDFGTAVSQSGNSPSYCIQDFGAR